MIRVLLVDDHIALRAGLTAVLDAEPGIVPLDAATSEDDLWPALRRTRPDVVLLDYHLPGRDGVALCRQVKRTLPPPKVLLYSAYADASLAIPALLAGADGVVHKGAPAGELYEALRLVAKGRRVLPPLSRELLSGAGARLDPEDLPVLGMVLDETPRGEVARTLRLEPASLDARIDRMLDRLRVEVPSGADV
ncbi:MAG TPA: response regulator transcription factor [Solirubrobacteraceae bacterium]|nr:response regulator transcription factor [Solirubrobacteraceae bacterium]